MSNEPKWIAEYDADTMDSIFAMHTPLYKTFYPQEVAQILNTLEAEVERLKEANEALESQRKEWADMCIKKQSEVERLQSELTEAICTLDMVCQANPNDATWNYSAAFHKAQQLITAFRNSQSNTPKNEL